MKKLLLVAAAALSMFVAIPAATTTTASAQVAVGVGPGGVGVRVGEPRRGYRERHVRERYASRPRCRVVRERIVTPRGRVIYKSVRVC